MVRGSDAFWKCAISDCIFSQGRKALTLLGEIGARRAEVPGAGLHWERCSDWFLQC